MMKNDEKSDCDSVISGVQNQFGLVNKKLDKNGEWVDESHGSLKQLELLAPIKIELTQLVDFICATVKDVVNIGKNNVKVSLSRVCLCIEHVTTWRKDIDIKLSDITHTIQDGNNIDTSERLICLRILWSLIRSTKFAMVLYSLRFDLFAARIILKHVNI